MANRLIRDKILTSDRVNCLSAGAEVFYRRLMSVADDFGRYDGRISILRSNMYPLRTEQISDQDITTWINECRDAGCVEFYFVDSKPYIEIWNFGQTIRIKKAKYPENPNKPHTGAAHLQTSANICEQMDSTRVSGVGVETNPIQSGVGVGVGLQKNSASTPANNDNKIIWNDKPLPQDVPDPPPDGILAAAVKNVEFVQRVSITPKDAQEYWEAWKVQHLSGEKYYPSLHDVHSHYLNCIKKERFNVKAIQHDNQQQQLSPAAQRIKERNERLNGQAASAGA